MADSFLENAGGWTPVPDTLAREYSFETAYVWGRIRRLCQLGGGAYTISHEAMGKRFGMSRRNLIDKLNELIKGGYVEDLTPNLRNRPHTYSVQKGEEKITGMQISHTETTIPGETEVIPVQDNDIGMRNLHSESVEIAQSECLTIQDLHSHYANSAYPTMQILHLNRDSSLDTLSETKEDSTKVDGLPSKPKRRKRITKPLGTKKESQAMFSALAALCVIDIGLLTVEDRGALNQAEKKMREKGYVPADVVAFGEWWYSHDWRGEKGQPPKLTEIRKTWGQFLKWRAAQTEKLLYTDPSPPPAPLPPHALVWQQAQAFLQPYADTLAGVEARSSPNGTFILAAPDANKKAWIDGRLSNTILKALRQFKPDIQKLEVLTQ